MTDQPRETARQIAQWKCGGCNHGPHGPVCLAGEALGKPAVCGCTGQPEHDVVCQHGTASDVHCCNCHSGFVFNSLACVCGSSTTRPAQSETARQIAEQIVGKLLPAVFLPGEDIGVAAKRERENIAANANIIEPIIASLTADLAQARQERDEWKRRAEDAEGRIANATA